MMVGRFRKKPDVIEAIQFQVKRDDAGKVSDVNLTDLREFLGDALLSPEGHGPLGVTRINDQFLPVFELKTTEGLVTVYPGDWIIKVMTGVFWPVKAIIFEATYEAVE